MSDKPKTGDQTREIQPLEMRATFQPGSTNEETRTVDVTWTTGEKVLRSSWDGQFFEELSLDPKHVRMGRLTSGRAPFLANHRSYDLESVIGVVESADVGTARVRFAKDDPAADAAWNKVRQGILPNVSVGYRVHKFEKVEGVETKTPTYRAIDWEPYEVSLVPMGADSAAHVRSEPELNKCVFTDLTRTTVQEEQQAMDETKNTPAPVVDTEAVRNEAIKAERERVSGIQSAVRAAKLGDELSTEMINSGVSLDKARAVVLEKLAARDAEMPPAANGNHIRVEITDDSKDKFIRGVSAALFERSHNGLVEQAKRKGVSGFEKVETDPGEYRGMGPLAACKEILERNGINTRRIYDPRELVKRAASTSDFPVLFENVLHKNMRAAYAVQDLTWNRLCATDTVPDFRDSNRFLNGSFGEVPVVAEGGEYQNLEIPDGEKISISTEKRGGIISLNWEAIVNDDMGALLDVAIRFGQGTARTIEKEFYRVLGLNSGLGPTMSDSQPFFHSNRANVSTAAAITAAALDADKQKMRAQTDGDANDYLDLMPRILLVPVGLESTAKLLNTDAYDPAQTGQKSNIARGMFGDIVSSPRLSWSTTRRYLFTDAKEAFKVVFLEGFGEGFKMESQDEFRRDATSWKCTIVFKVNPYEPRAAVTNAGT